MCQAFLRTQEKSNPFSGGRNGCLLISIVLKPNKRAFLVHKSETDPAREVLTT